VAVLRYAGRDINLEMVAEGMAWAYRQFLQRPYASEYLGAEDRARARRAGLWRDANPQPPWEFRRALRGGRRPGRRHW
jgi:micrococcal nuclease